MASGSSSVADADKAIDLDVVDGDCVDQPWCLEELHHPCGRRPVSSDEPLLCDRKATWFIPPNHDARGEIVCFRVESMAMQL